MSADSVIVVGGGHIGLACAHYLHKDGHDVTVIDQGDIGGACSYANCGYIVPSHVLPLTTPDALGKGLKSLFQPRAAFRIKPQLRPALLRWLFEFGRRCNRSDMLTAGKTLHTLLDASVAEYGELLKNDDLACEWRGNGMLFVFRNRQAFDEFGETDALVSSEFGVQAKPLSGQELPEYEPALLDGLAGAWSYPGDSHLRPDQLNDSWRSMLEKGGVQFMDHCGLESITRTGKEVVSIQTTQGRMTAERYVFALGAWSSEIADDLGCSIPVEPGKGYSVTMTRPDIMPTHPMLMPERHVGVTPFETGYRIASMMEFAGYDTSIPRFRIRQLQDSVRPYLREPTGRAVKQTWYGWRPMTWDSLPIIGRVPQLGNALLATGHNMLGLSLAPITGKLIAQLAAEKPTDLPVDAISPSRFN